MSIETVLPYVQLVLSVALVVVVLMQQRGSGAGAAFGGGGEVTYKRRGAEKALFNITIVLGILFAATAFIAVLL